MKPLASAAALAFALSAAGTPSVHAEAVARPVGNPPSVFARLIAEETPRWAALLKDAGVSAN